MRNELQLEEEEAYETLPGCPTLTFPLQNFEQALPYYSFKSANYQKDRIVIEFEAGTLTISGASLSELWRHLQVQDVRSVKCYWSGIDDEIRINSIEWKKRVEKKV